MTRLGTWGRRLWEDFSSVFVSETQSIRVQAENASQFGEFLVAGRTPIIELNSSYGTTALRDAVTLVGSGAKDDINGTTLTGEIKISTGATASSSSLLESSEVARYIPGYGAEMGMGIRIPVAPTGDQVARWGGRSPLNGDGLYFQYDSDGLSVVRKRDGVEDKYPQSEWNKDKLDGTGQSGINLDVADGYIFQIDYTWYAYGGIKFNIIGTPSGLFQRPIAVHTLGPSDYLGTSIRSPSLKLFQEVENGSTTSNFDIFIGGRQYSIVGNYIPKYRFTGDARGSRTVSTTVLPLVSFQIKSGFVDRSIKLDAYNLINNGNNTVLPEIRLGGTLTGASWQTPTNHTASETALESDISATAISGGVVVWAGDLVGPAKDGGRGLSTVDLDIPEGEIVSLCARTFIGSSDVIAGKRLREEW